MGQWVVSGQMTSLIKPELVDIIRFCLKIYDLWKHPHLWVDGRVNGWAHVKSLKSNKFDLIEIIQLWTFWTFWDILLKPPQPLMGLFLSNLDTRDLKTYLITYSGHF